MRKIFELNLLTIIERFGNVTSVENAQYAKLCNTDAKRTGALSLSLRGPSMLHSALPSTRWRDGGGGGGGCELKLLSHFHGTPDSHYSMYSTAMKLLCPIGALRT